MAQVETKIDPRDWRTWPVCRECKVNAVPLAVTRFGVCPSCAAIDPAIRIEYHEVRKGVRA